MEAIADIDDDAKFITWDNVPPRSEGDYDNSYQKREITHHWCLLGEIVWAGRISDQAHHINVKDKKGIVDTFMIHCPKKYSISRFCPGKTVALLYFEERHDRSGASKLSKRYLTASTIEIFPFTIVQIVAACRKAKLHYSVIESSEKEGSGRDAEGDLDVPHTCQYCGKNDMDLVPCGRCKLVWYCNNLKKENCRKKDRLEKNHAATCKVLKGMKGFLERDWDNFEDFWVIDTGN